MRSVVVLFVSTIRDLQSRMFDLLGFSKEEAEKQFGFLMSAFEYGAPPHGGFAFGFDRLVAILGGAEVIRDFIAFPKNNAGRDVMIDAPATIDEAQLNELKLVTTAESGRITRLDFCSFRTLKKFLCYERLHYR
jgi:aspartyl-tRNA synthetase